MQHSYNFVIQLWKFILNTLGTDPADVLQKLVQKSVDINDCRQKYKERASSLPVTPGEKICAGGEGGIHRKILVFLYNSKKHHNLLYI